MFSALVDDTLLIVFSNVHSIIHQADTVVSGLMLKDVPIFPAILVDEVKNIIRDIGHFDGIGLDVCHDKAFLLDLSFQRFHKEGSALRNNIVVITRISEAFEKYTRNTLDLSAVPIIHEKTHLPIIVDPSHATGKANLVEPMMIAAVAAGADGLEVEVHYDPRHAWSDGAQCLTPDAFAQAMAKCRQVAWAIGREM